MRILIVGAGPVGVTMANLLGVQGIETLVIDRSPAILDYPRAVGLDDEALRASLELVKEAERLGYHRYWVAEHHNMPGIASSAPAVLIAHIAQVTERRASLAVGTV